MPQVGIVFEVRHADTLPGETVRVVGGTQELGDWDPLQAVGSGVQEDALQLRTGALRYPRWSTTAPVWISFDDEEQQEEADEELEDAEIQVCQPGDTCVNWLIKRKGSLDEGSTDSSTITPDSQDLTPAEEVQDDHTWPNIEVEYKFVKDLRQLLGNSLSSFHWEERIKNRRAAVPKEPGSMWLISDARWNLDEPPTVTRIVQAELLSRCLELDPDYLQNKKRGSLFGTQQEHRGRPAREQGPTMTIVDEPDLDQAAFAISTPVQGSSSTSRSVPSFDIDDEFEALACQQLPSLLAEKLAAEKTASELAAEVMALRREGCMLEADRARAEDEARTLRAEVGELRDAVQKLSVGLEATMAQQDADADLMRQKSAVLQEENAELRDVVAGLRAENRELVAELLAVRALLPKEELSPTARTVFALGKRRSGSNSLEDMEGHEVADLEAQLASVRSSLSTPMGKVPGKWEQEAETELMKVLRRRRMKVESHVAA